MNRQNLSRFFTTLGYVALSFQLLWTVSAYMPFFLESDLIDTMLSPPAPKPDMALSSDFSWVSMIVAAIAATTAIGLGIYAIWRAPKVVTNKAEHATKRASLRLSQPISQKHHLTKAQTLSLSRQVQLLLKIVVSISIFVALLPSSALDTELPHTMLLFVGVWLLPWPSVWFLLGYFIAQPPNQKTPLPK